MPTTSEIENIKKSPATFVVFGATGDLARKRIFPALFKLYKANLLPTAFKIIAAARTEHSSENFRAIVDESLSAVDKEKIPSFFEKIQYVPLDVAEDKNLTEVTNAISEFEKEAAGCVKRIYYMAISPTILEEAVENLGKNGLHLACQNHNDNKPLVIVEKPFGQDLKSAQKIAQVLSKYFVQDQIYRIDHYLGKETVQNIFAFRFANELFESLWNNKFIDHIQITTAENIGVEKRGAFYDKTGALRDIIQNHIIQLLALIAMEEPEDSSSKSIKEKKLEVIKNIKKLTPEEIKTSTVRGQYEGYLEEENIEPNSKTESYAMTKLFIENERWQGVPFYLRTGKRLTGKVTSIILQFKDRQHKIFEGFENPNIPNTITIQIQPNEGIGIRLTAKKPGLTSEFEPVAMEFCYKTSFDTPQPEAYERLLLDVILGNQSLFISQEEIEESWKVIDPIEEAWSKNEVPLTVYKPGTWGAEEAEEILKKDGREWLQPILTICKI
ncbi:MAG: glucose-6-phosphate dehydrogenase [Candidatus Curtissbacteria bacterium]|nr:glucose-6-phosphate dehydrogenase [Candidatus Curtissbacteria bacterium]